MANTKVRCSVCKDFFARNEMLKTGVGLGGVCSEACMNAWKEKYRKKRVRRREHRALKHTGSRIPGTVRGRVRRRDNERCRWCQTRNSLELHHVRYRSEGGPDSPKNLVTLCHEHHLLMHTNKRVYQPTLLVFLWAYYTKGFAISLHKCYHIVKDNKQPTWVDEARKFSDGVMAASKPERQTIIEDEAA